MKDRRDGPQVIGIFFRMPHCVIDHLLERLQVWRYIFQISEQIGKHRIGNSTTIEPRMLDYAGKCAIPPETEAAYGNPVRVGNYIVNQPFHTQCEIIRHIATPLLISSFHKYFYVTL